MARSVLRPGAQAAAVATPERRDRAVDGAIVLVAVVAAVVCAAPLGLPHDLVGSHSYDDAVYLGAAVRLIHGALPYRDFAFAQPPGIAVAMAPVALVGQLIGDRDALAVARLVTLVVAAADAALVGRLLAPRGVGAVLAGGLAMALYPAAATADSTLLLEPYLVAGCLLGALLVFGSGAPASRARLVAGGVAFGLAGTVKLWAVIPALALVTCLSATRRRDVPAVVCGMALGFCAVTVVFFAAAPGAFVHDVIVSQLTRATPSGQGTSVAGRLLVVTGLPLLFARLAGWGVDLALGVAVVSGYALGWRRISALEWFALVSLAGSLVAVLVVGTFYPHYAYVPGAFAAVCLGVSASELAALARQRLRWRLGSLGRGGKATALGLAGLAVVFVFVHDLTSARDFVRGSSLSDPGPGLAAQIPPGACVVFDEPSFAILANRFTSGLPDCPPLVDPFGLWLSLDPSDPPPSAGPYPHALTADWQLWLSEAQYLVLVAPGSDFLPWSPALSTSFGHGYRLVYSVPGTYLYANDGFTGS